MSDSPSSGHHQEAGAPRAVAALPQADPRQLLHKAWGFRGIAALAGVIAFLMLPAWLGWATRFVAGWDLAVLILVVEGWWVITRSDAERTRQHAAIDDPGRVALLAISVGASAVSMLATLLIIRQEQPFVAAAPAWARFALSLAAIAGPWLLLHTAYTLHYAHLYYGDGEMAGSLAFRGGPPDGWDFAYFAFGIGMTFQVPDIDVTDGAMRRVVLRHQLVSFGYNTAILALVVNLIAGHL